MSKLILNTECKLYTRDGLALYSSRQVAEEFDKRHANVLRSIDEVPQLNFESSGETTERKNALSAEVIRMLAGQTIEEFYSENFFEHHYKDASGKRSREVLMTRKGATFVVMGFTGTRAAVVKIGLLNRFEAMEKFIASLTMARLEHPAFTSAIADAHEEPKHYHFVNESNMINRIVLGMDAKKFRELHGIEKGKSIRPYLSMEQIKAVEELQRVDIGLLLAVPEYKVREQLLTRRFEQMRLKRIA